MWLYLCWDAKRLSGLWRQFKEHNVLSRTTSGKRRAIVCPHLLQSFWHNVLSVNQTLAAYLSGGRFKNHYYTEVQFVYNTEYSLGVLNTKVEFFWVCRASRKCNTGASCDVNLSDASLTCLNTDRCELLLRCILTLRSGRAIHMRIAARNAFEARLH